MDDELFMAESSPSYPNETSSSVAFLHSFINIFSVASSNSKKAALYMLRSKLRAVAHASRSHTKSIILKYFRRWSFIDPRLLADQKLILGLSVCGSKVKYLLHKYWAFWENFVKNQRNFNKLTQARHKREQAHLSQLGQMNKVFQHILNKQAELEKAILNSASKEIGFKDVIRDINTTRGNGGKSAYLKELQRENQELWRKIEAAENCASGFIRELEEFVGSHEDNCRDEAVAVTQIRTILRKKSNFLR